MRDGVVGAGHGSGSGGVPAVLATVLLSCCSCDWGSSSSGIVWRRWKCN